MHGKKTEKRYGDKNLEILLYSFNRIKNCLFLGKKFVFDIIYE